MASRFARLHLVDRVLMWAGPSSGRYKVRLDGGGNGGRPLGLLPVNLRLLGPKGLEPEPEPEL